MKNKTKKESEPRKNRELREETRIPVDWKLLVVAEALKPW